MKTVRCAIYTRKSSEEGLEQAFNSLDAQREACAAYILSQASEGWSALPDIYDDGGLSGGSLERPALQRLLADVAAGRIDIIVVYKVDRLTRSLLDFAKLVEAFDSAGTSFVSVTQSFNTTNSMGRLTLNMLLSFAQFEREVTAERIRDKIAASKARGMWMGGTPPLGYRPDERSLAIVEEHAAIIRDIYRRYLETGNVRLVADDLTGEGILSPLRSTAGGRSFGGVRFSRGQLYAILKNPIYIGEIRHQGRIHAGRHAAIIDREVWTQVQERLAEHLKGDRRAPRAAKPSLLAGLIFDESGDSLVAVHACKGRVRYRYYVSRSLHHGVSAGANAGIRMPAREIEAAVAVQIVEALNDPLSLAARSWINIAPDELHAVVARSREAAVQLMKRDRQLTRDLVLQVRVFNGRVEIDLSTKTIGGMLGVVTEESAPASVTLSSEIRLTRSGTAVRLVQSDGKLAGETMADPALIRLFLKARYWWGQLRAGELDISGLAAQEGVTDAYISRVVRTVFLAPDIVDAILDGKNLASLTSQRLTAPDAVALDWSMQRREFLPLSR